MRKTISTSLFLFCAAAPTWAQQALQGFHRLPSGLEYQIVKDVPGTRYARIGDIMEFHIHMHLEGDSTMLFDSRRMNEDKAVPLPIQKAAYHGDIAEGLLFLTAGDSVLFRTPVDSMAKMSGGQLQPPLKAGANQMLRYEIQVVTVKSALQVKTEATAAAKKQKAIDDKLLKAYFLKNKLKPKKTLSGLYYIVHTPGTGPVAKNGNKLAVNYTGRLLTGATFDSNIDPAFSHVEPLSVTLNNKGSGVIEGWSEGLHLAKKGTVITLYVPSPMAYGPHSPDPRKIPENAIMVFDITVKDIK